MTTPTELTYRLMHTGQTESVILSKNFEVGERKKVHLQNTAHPFNKIAVDAWLSESDDGLRFNYGDGVGGPMWLSIEDARDFVFKTPNEQTPE